MYLVLMIGYILISKAKYKWGVPCKVQPDRDKVFLPKVFVLLIAQINIW